MKLHEMLAEMYLSGRVLSGKPVTEDHRRRAYDLFKRVVEHEASPAPAGDCVCGHPKAAHIYGAGACRRGYKCGLGCTKYNPAAVPSASDAEPGFVVCPACKGTGSAPPAGADGCGRCAGEGQIPANPNDICECGPEGTQYCPIHGTGWVASDDASEDQEAVPPAHESASPAQGGLSGTAPGSSDDVWFCNKCDFAGQGGPVHVRPRRGGMMCPYAAANLSEWDRRLKASDKSSEERRDQFGHAVDEHGTLAFDPGCPWCEKVASDKAGEDA